MCRLLGWLGAPRTLHELVVAPPLGLLRQSYAPQRQQHGLVNADGWGVAWWSAEQREPARWRSTRPLWHDVSGSFGSVAPHVRTACLVASVRSATVGMPLEESATAPFTRGVWALAHNGVVDRACVPPGAEAEQSTCDSAVLASWLLDDPAQLGRCTAQLARADPGARLNLIVGDGHQLLATRWGDTLSWLEQPDGVLVASEPVDDSPGWRDVPERHLLHVGPTGVTVTSLDPLGPPPDPQETT